MVKPESVLPTPAPVTIQTALMTQEKLCAHSSVMAEGAVSGEAAASAWAGQVSPWVKV